MATSFAFVLLGVASAKGQPVRLRLAYEAEAGCPNANAFEARVAERLERPPFDASAGRVLQVRIEAYDERYSAELRVGDAVRRLSAADCLSVAEAAASSAAVALVSIEQGLLVLPNVDEPPVVDERPVVEDDGTPETVGDAGTVEGGTGLDAPLRRQGVRASDGPRTPPRNDGEALMWSIYFEGGADLGVSGSGAFSLAVGTRMHRKRWALRVAGVFRNPMSQGNARSERMLGASVEACFATVFDVCGYAEASRGWVSSRDETAAVPYLAAGLSAHAVMPIGRTWYGLSSRIAFPLLSDPSSGPAADWRAPLSYSLRIDFGVSFPGE